MYKSPIKIEMGEPFYEQTKNAFDEYVVSAVQRVNVSVDRTELIKALSYDRGQYEKGYADGKSESPWLPAVLTQPKRDGKYFVLVECGGELDIDILSWDSKRGWCYWSDLGTETIADDWNDAVLYWMETPEKPKYEKS